jgi:hypothetical protein
MPLTSFTIGGVEVNPLVESFEVRETTGGISTLSCDVTSTGSPVVRFSIHRTVVVQEDGVTIFAGTITQARERGYGGPNLYTDGGDPQIITTITVEDYNRLAERIHVTETVAAGTLLKTFLTTLVADVSVMGITLHPSQVNGPALPEMSFDHALASDVLRALSDATGFVWRIDYDQQLRMWAPGDLAAPFDIDEFDTPAKWTGDVEVETILGDDYANRVIVIVDPIQQDGRIESFAGDGTSGPFYLQYTPTKLYGHILVASGGGETLGLITDSPIQWSYDPLTNSITREIGPTAIGETYNLYFDGVFSAEATAEDAGAIAAYGLYELIEHRTDIPDGTSAQALADALLAEHLQAGEQKVSYDTRQPEPSLRVGQLQGITATARDLSGSYLITDMRVRAETPVTAEFAAAGLGFLRSITVKKNHPLSGKWEDTYRDWLKVGSTSGSITIGAGGVSSGGPAPPIMAVQFNAGSAFGGDVEFTYNEATNSVVCGGGGSSITAADVESCQVFGYDNHIADP